MTPLKTLALLVPLSFACAQATAEPFDRVLPEQSRVEFRFTQMGAEMTGRFQRFEADLAFDPEAPTEGRVVMDVALGSIDTGIADLDAEALGRRWFNVEAFPTARFVSTAVQALGDDAYSLTGTLDIKGTRRELVVPVRLAREGGNATFTGSFTLQRGDFAIGEGAWADYSLVANEVVVEFHITATRD